MPRLLCVIVKPQVDKCAADTAPVPSFLIMLVSYIPLAIIFAHEFSLQLALLGRESRFSRREIAANHPRLKSGRWAATKPSPNPLFWGPYLGGVVNRSRAAKGTLATAKWRTQENALFGTMQTRRLWRRAAALAGGAVVGFLCISALRQPPDEPRARRLQEWDGEKVGPDGTGVRPLRCFQGYQQIQGGGHWTQGAVVHNASLPSDGAHLQLADHALLLSNARVRPVTLAATDEAALIKSCSSYC